MSTFAPVNLKRNFIELEHHVLDFWREAGIFEPAPRANDVAPRRDMACHLDGQGA